MRNQHKREKTHNDSGEDGDKVSREGSLDAGKHSAERGRRHGMLCGDCAMASACQVIKSSNMSCLVCLEPNKCPALRYIARGFRAVLRMPRYGNTPDHTRECPLRAKKGYARVKFCPYIHSKQPLFHIIEGLLTSCTQKSGRRTF